MACCVRAGGQGATQAGGVEGSKPRLAALPPPGSLQISPNLLLQNNRAQLSASVTSHVESTKAGLDMLGRAHQALQRMRDNFDTINHLCVECQSLIDCHDKIRLLSAVHYNLRKTLLVRAALANCRRASRRFATPDLLRPSLPPFLLPRCRMWRTLLPCRWRLLRPRRC